MENTLVCVLKVILATGFQLFALLSDYNFGVLSFVCDKCQNTMAAFESLEIHIIFYFKNSTYLVYNLLFQNFSTVLVIQTGYGISLKTANVIIMKVVNKCRHTPLLHRFLGLRKTVLSKNCVIGRLY